MALVHRITRDPTHVGKGPLLLMHEEPSQTLTDIDKPLFQRLLRLLAEKLDHHVAPCQGRHSDASSLNHICLLHLAGDFGKPEEEVDLGQEPPPLGSATEGSVCPDTGVGIHKELDVIIQVDEILTW